MLCETVSTNNCECAAHTYILTLYYTFICMDVCLCWRVRRQLFIYHLFNILLLFLLVYFVFFFCFFAKFFLKHLSAFHLFTFLSTTMKYFSFVFVFCFVHLFALAMVSFLIHMCALMQCECCSCCSHIRSILVVINWRTTNCQMKNCDHVTLLSCWVYEKEENNLHRRKLGLRTCTHIHAYVYIMHKYIHMCVYFHTYIYM